MPTETMPKEASTQIETFGMKVRKLWGRDDLFKVWNPENEADVHIVNLNVKTCDCSDFANSGACRHIEAVNKRDEIHRQNHRVWDKEYCQKHSSDIEFRQKRREASHNARLRYKKGYERFVTEWGGKCVICGEGALSAITVHHPNKKQDEGGHAFSQTKEFRLWLRGGIKPNVFLICRNHHGKLDDMIKQGIVPFNCKDLDFLRNILR